jgi:trigger factor
MATITRENIGPLNDKITVKVEKNDYLASFEKTLKQYSKKANIPGFRKGMVPASLVKKMYGNSVFTDEVLRSVEKELTSYVTTEKLDIFAQPLPLAENDASSLDMSNPSDYAFAFEVGLKPDFAIADLATAPLTRYVVPVTQEMVNEELDRLQVRHGKMTEPEAVSNDENVLNLTFAESDAQGNLLDDGTVKDNSLLVKYFSESFRNNWMGKKKDDYLVLQLSAAFDDKEREWILNDLGFTKDDTAAAEKYFKVSITKLGYAEKAPLDEEFFKTIYPGKEIKTEAEFLEVIKSEIQEFWLHQAKNLLQHGVYHVLLDETKIEFPESFLKRWLAGSGEKTKQPDEVERDYPVFTQQLKWTLILDKIIRENNIEIAQEDIRAFAKQQLFSYMGGRVVDENQPWVTDYINRMVQDKRFVEDAVHHIQTDKVLAWAETQTNPVEKEIAREEFEKMQQEHKHHHH